MYTATMKYQFKKEYFEQACEIWKTEIMDLAQKQAGFVRLQFLVSDLEAMAIGTWEDRHYAQEFMQTGVFKRLTSKLEDMLSAAPQPKVWEQKYYTGYEKG